MCEFETFDFQKQESLTPRTEIMSRVLKAKKLKIMCTVIALIGECHYYNIASSYMFRLGNAQANELYGGNVRTYEEIQILE